MSPMDNREVLLLRCWHLLCQVISDVKSPWLLLLWQKVTFWPGLTGLVSRESDEEQSERKMVVPFFSFQFLITITFLSPFLFLIFYFGTIPGVAQR